MLRQALHYCRLLAAACVALAAAGSAHAQAFPAKPITLVSPYQPGGGADGIGRVLAEAASRELGQPIVVDAKPGAEGMIGSLDVARSPADGYRLLWGGAGSMMLSTALRKNPPFDPATAFTPVAATVDFSMFLYVPPSFPANNVQEFIAYVKANPGKVSYASSGGLSLLNMADLASRHGLDMVRVPYKGEASAATDLVTNRVQALFATTSIGSFVREGKLKMLVTTLPQRSPLFPEVPTFQEAGLPLVAFGGGWLGIYAPPGLPQPVFDRLNKAFSKAYTDPRVQEYMLKAGLVYTHIPTQEALVAYTRDQRDLYRKSVRELKIPLVD